MSENKKILFFFPFNKNLTGGPRVLLNMLEALDRDRFTPIVLTQKESVFTDEVRKLRVRCEVMALPNSIDGHNEKVLKQGVLGKIKSLLGLLKYNRQVSNFIKKEDIALCWVRNVKSVMMVGRGVRKARIPLVWDIGMEKPSKGLVKYIHDFGLKWSRLVVAESYAQFPEIFGEERTKKFKSKLRSISPGIPVERVTQIKNARLNKIKKEDKVLTIACIGTLDPRKNQGMLVKVASLLKNGEYSFKIKLVGPVNDESYVSSLKEEIDSHGLKNDIEFVGWLDDVPDFLAAVDLVVNCATNEGIPYVIHEALHAHLPIVATNVGGLVDCVVEGRNGYLVKVDDVETMAHRIDELLKSEEKRIAFGNFGAVHAEEKFSVKTWSAEYDKVFNELIA